jgi:uncharacterized membrane protein YfcA
MSGGRPGGVAIWPEGHGSVTLRALDVGIASFVIGVVVVAVAAQAVAGFGFALIAMPLLVLVLNVRDALVLATLISLANTSVLAYTHRATVPWETVMPMFLGAAAGMPVGLAVLLLAPADAIRLLVGASTIVMSLALVRGARFGSRSTTAELAVGAVSGALNTSTGTNGPPVVLYLQGREHPPPEFRGALAAFFTGSSVVSILSFLVAGIVTRDAVALFAIAMPAVAVASWLGHQLADRVEPLLFRRLVFGLLFAVATSAVASAIAGLAG